MPRDIYPGIRYDLLSHQAVLKIINIHVFVKTLKELYTLEDLEERYERDLKLTCKKFKQFEKLANGKTYNFEKDFHLEYFKSYSYSKSKNEIVRKKQLINSIMILAETNIFIRFYTKQIQKSKE